MTANTTVPGSWRRHSTKEFTALAFLISLTVFLVHRTTLSRQNADLPMDRILGELESNCHTALKAGTGGATAKLPPALYGLGVWVDSAALLSGVHAALTLMKERLSGEDADSFPPPTHSLHSFVRVQSHLRDIAVAELVTDARRNGIVSGDNVNRKLEYVASQQQLGMATMKHAFLPQIGQEVELHGLSLFSVPAELLPEGSRVECYVADVRQAYCVFPVNATFSEKKEAVVNEEQNLNSCQAEEENADTATAKNRKGLTPSSGSSPTTAITAASYRTHADSIEAEVRAALLSVMTRQMELRSFKPADIADWKQQREEQGCIYTISSVKNTLRSIEANTNMVIPLNTRHMFADLERHVQAKAFVRAARAADNLQFHPSLTPQLYIPWDHSLVSQLTILLPVVSMTSIALRFLVDERRTRRVRAARAAIQAKKEQ